MATQILSAAETAVFVGNSYMSLEDMIAQLQAELVKSSVDVTVNSGNHNLSDMHIGTLNVGGTNPYVAANVIETLNMYSNFGYVTTRTLTEEATITGINNSMFARNAEGVNVTIEEAKGVSFYTYNFADGQTDITNSSGINIYATDADNSEHMLWNVDGGQARIEGNYVEVDVWSSDIDRLSVQGYDIEVSLGYSNVDDLDIGNWGKLDIYHSFMNGEVDFGTEVFASHSHVILDLKKGGNDITLKGGQALLDAANGQVDHFEFTEGARVDGAFDPFDVVQMVSGAEWTMGELAVKADEDEAFYFDGFGQFELGAYVETYDDFGGKG
jgi:hypothetical protein